MYKMKLHVREFEEYHDKYFPWSIIYIELDEQAFPDNQWWDASASILEIWAHNITKLICGQEHHCVLPFMDGDYRIEITLITPRTSLATCYGNNDTVVMSGTIDLLYFSRQILAAIGRMHNHYFEHTESLMLKRLIHESNMLQSMIRKQHLK